MPVHNYIYEESMYRIKDLIDNGKQRNILLNLLSYADGKHDILDIVKIAKYDLNEIIEVLQICLDQKLIKFPK